jgi:hypothetical protein
MRIVDQRVPAASGVGRVRLKRDGTRPETRFGLSGKRMSLFKSAGCQFSRVLAVEESGSAGSGGNAG